MCTSAFIYYINPLSNDNVLASTQLANSGYPYFADSASIGIIAAYHYPAGNELRLFQIKSTGFSNIQTPVTIANFSEAASVSTSVSMSSDGKYVAFAHNANARVYVYERKPCHSSCATCSGPNDGHCLSCVVGNPEGTPRGFCQCSSNCQTCKSNSFTQCETCNQAVPEKYLLPFTSKCVACNLTDQLPYGLLCVECGPNCVDCSQTDKMQCTACLPGFYLYEDATCRPCETASGRYVDGITCKPCDDNCLTCSDFTACLSCNRLSPAYPWL